MSEVRAAERVVRRFARDTNLLIAARPAAVRVDPNGRYTAVASELERMLRSLGARIADVSAAPRPAGLVEFAFDALTGGARAEDVPILVDGAPVIGRGDAAGRIAFAGTHMPVAREVAAGLGDAVSGLRVGVAMVLEPKTAQLALLLRDAGADVAVYAHPDEFDPDVAAALRSLGVPVDGDPALAGTAEVDAVLAFLHRGFDVVLDDGSHLIRLAHERAPDLVDGWIGATEETTSGLTPLRVMAGRGILRTAVMAVNDAQTKTRFDNRYGTGQSCVFAIADVLDAIDLGVRDQPALVIGYGPVGEGVAAHLAALGARVVVAETDPVRALVAAHDGFEVGPAADLARDALVVSATGVRHTVTSDILADARIVAVAGGVPAEVDLTETTLAPVPTRTGAAPHVERSEQHGTLVLDRGGCINITAAEGNPIEIMDLSFAVQLAAVHQLVSTRPGPGIHPVGPDIDARVARAALLARGLHVSAALNAPGAPGARPSRDHASLEWRSARYGRPAEGGTP